MSELRDMLAERLGRRLGRPLRLTIHDNRKVMLSFRYLAEGRLLSLRLHHMFFAARAREIGAITRFVRSKDPASRRTVEAFISRYGHLIGVKLPEPARGVVYDLERIFRRLNRRFFRNRVQARILWGRRVHRERRRTIRLGYYCDTDKKIVINPALDRRSVPRYVVEWIVFHEMLHQVVGFIRIRGMFVAHSPEFRRREQSFPRFEEASRWESRNLSRLLRA